MFDPLTIGLIAGSGILGLSIGFTLGRTCACCL